MFYTTRKYDAITEKFYYLVKLEYADNFIYAT